MAALRPADGTLKHQPELVLVYEEPADAWTAVPLPVPSVNVVLSPEDLETKLAALALYRSQTRPHPSSRSETTLRALAQLRGGQCGLPLAEAFRCLRWRI
ncbi:hypothetical protein [Dactylosporangium sp. NPDC051484]|uniref:hypothetical protein n=1 Tax=Dactylosporangium sp. NPDC051484 TaxID=3154942 RepID=UPI00344C95EA